MPKMDPIFGENGPSHRLQASQRAMTDHLLLLLFKPKKKRLLGAKYNL